MELSKLGADSRAPLSAGWRVAAGRGRHCHCQGRRSRGRKHWGPGRSQCWRLPVPPGGSAARPERSGLPETQEKYMGIYALGYCPQAHVWLLDSDKSIYTEVKHTHVFHAHKWFFMQMTAYSFYIEIVKHAHTHKHANTLSCTHMLTDLVTAVKHPLGYCRNMRPTAQNWWNTNAPILWLQKIDLSRYTSDPSCTHTHTLTHTNTWRHITHDKMEKKEKAMDAWMLSLPLPWGWT